MSAYIQMFSVHGLIRADNMELGRDADTGGQVKYVVELGQHLSQRDDIDRVDLFTRLIGDKSVSSDYAAAIETVNPKFRIVRIQCGGRKYMRKELLWPHLDEFVDKTIKFIKRHNTMPDVVHGHYPDAGYVAMQLSHFLGMPFVYTGHSLGRSKLRKLLGDGMQHREIQKKYRIDQRIEVEENILAHADLVITSTRQEREAQYGDYRHHNVPVYAVIPPGIDIDKFYPAYYNKLSESSPSENAMFAQASMLQALNRFFLNPEKPMILALCRPDKRKNISGLVKAYGEDLELQAMANLAVFAGIRKDIDTMEDNERDVLTRMLLLMDKYDLYGRMAIPKKHDFEFEVPALYRIAAESRGVFINPALTEPFGLTLLEASATGLPIVATNDGGPNDIIENCENGILVDATDSAAIAAALKKIIADPALWENFSKNGILNARKYYTWESHAASYVQAVTRLSAGSDADDMAPAVATNKIGRRLIDLNAFLFTDIDHTLIGEDNRELDTLLALLKEHRRCIGFGVASGRSIESVKAILKKHAVPTPDIIVASVGSEIYYGPRHQYGQGWAAHIGKRWNRKKIVKLLEEFDFLEYQDEDGAQRPFKISYYMTPAKDRLSLVHNRLLQHKCRYNLIYSHDKYLDILPYRASKGKAIRYISYKWEIPLRHFLVCGDSGNDEEMLRGEPLAVVVGNYSQELRALKGSRNVFFARRACTGGILEGLQRYNFLTKAQGYCREHS
ncbi:MAG: HAD-IIB family hydrolase [Desulfobacterales bacterium]|jgi:sucrose-phosphate synthase